MFSLVNSTRNLCLNQNVTQITSFHTSACLERARKGTRERKRKAVLKAIKAKADRLRKNPPPIPHKVELMLKAKGLWGPPKYQREQETDLPFPKDNVFFAKNYAYKRYDISEAVDQLRQICHPSLLGDQNCLVNVKIEFDMKGSKKDRYMDNFSKTVPIVKHYDRNVPDRQCVVFVPNEELRLQALQEGAFMAGGQELIVEISKGQVDVAEVDHYLCHTELAAYLRPLTNTIRDKVPHASAGTIGTDIVRMIQTFAKGMHLSVQKTKNIPGYAEEPDYASCRTTIGRLEMSPEDMNENLTAILERLNESKPKRKDGTGFITRVSLYCLPNDLPLAELPKYFQFSIKHKEIYDPRLDEQEKALTEGRKQIMENVAKLKSEQS